MSQQTHTMSTVDSAWNLRGMVPSRRITVAAASLAAAALLAFASWFGYAWWHAVNGGEARVDEDDGEEQIDDEALTRRAGRALLRGMNGQVLQTVTPGRVGAARGKHPCVGVHCARYHADSGSEDA